MYNSLIELFLKNLIAICKQISVELIYSIVITNTWLAAQVFLSIIYSYLPLSVSVYLSLSYLSVSISQTISLLSLSMYLFMNQFLKTRSRSFWNVTILRAVSTKKQIIYSLKVELSDKIFIFNSKAP